MNDIIYEEFSKQEYLTNYRFSNDEASLLLALRTRTVRGVKGNFPSMYREDKACPLQCQEPEAEDSQEHIQLCPVLLANLSRQDEDTAWRVTYCNIYGTVEEQKESVSIFSVLLDTRERLLKERKVT